MRTLEKMNTKNLSSHEATLLGSFNVLCHDNINSLTAKSGLPGDIVERQLGSLIDRGLISARHGWADRHMPYGIDVAQDSRPIVEVFRSMTRLHDILRFEADVNSDHGVSGAIRDLGRIARLMQSRLAANVANDWDPSIAVRKMLVVSEFTEEQVPRVLETIRKDQGKAGKRAAADAGSHARSDAFGAVFLELDRLDSILRKDVRPFDFGLSGAIYNLGDIVVNRQSRPATKEGGRIMLSEFDDYHNFHAVWSMASANRPKEAYA
ncbi:MAG: hypothetical protein KGH58_01580 [Candidatus Micrarchaeota archaeon]|nr:hypothetical protein [Candidatus Micrarchaeota archaeon]